MPKNLRWRFLRLVFFRVHFVAKRYILKCLNGKNIGTCLLKTLVQLLSLYTDPGSSDPEKLRTTMHSVTDGRHRPTVAKTLCNQINANQT